MSNPKSTPSVFSHRPKADDMPEGHDLWRVPASGIQGLTILSHDTVGAYVHYFGGRTQPCTDVGCKACEANKQPRWRGYLFVLRGRSERTGVVELTAACMAEIDQAFSTYRTLRGCGLTLTRKGQLANGKLYADLHAPKESRVALPKAPSLEKFLAKIWDLRTMTPETVVTDEMLRMRSAEIDDQPGRKLG